MDATTANATTANFPLAMHSGKVHQVARFIKHPNRSRRHPDLMMPVLACGTRGRTTHPSPLNAEWVAEWGLTVNCKRCLGHA